MPHSTQDSFDSANTFDLTLPDDRPPTPPEARTMKSQSRASSNSYGMAVTSASTANTERSMLPSQQKSRTVLQDPQLASGDLKSLRRRSTPGTLEDYAAASTVSRGEIERLAQQHLQQKSQQQQRRSANLNNSENLSHDDASKRRTQYYEDQFQYKENSITQTREKIQRQTPVIAELKTNVIIKDEFTLVTDLSYQLAQRYTRPDSCIMLKIEHSACLAMGATFDPCYILTVNAVSSQMGPSTNKRNATLIQAFMADILSVPTERGIIKFIPIPEENFATGGTTILGEMEKAEKQERSSAKKTVEDAPRKSAMSNRKSMPKMDSQVNGTSQISENARVSGNSPINSSARVNGNSGNSHVNNSSTNGSAHANGTANVNGNAYGSSEKDVQNNPQVNDTRADTPMEKQTSHDSSDGSQIERPRTAHGTGPAAVNGLRMNPISAAELRGVATPQQTNRRPKSVGAPVRSSMPDQVRRDPLPRLAQQSAEPRSTQTKLQPTKAKTLTKPQNSTPLAPRPVQVQLNPVTTSSITTPFSPITTTTKIQSTSAQDKQNRSVYMDMVTALPLKPETQSSVSVFELETAAARSNSTGDATAAANTAIKRRSATITSTKSATSRSFDPIPLMPPPPVEADETRSFSSRLSKRKSFLKMFKREGSVPAWYKQN